MCKYKVSIGIPMFNAEKYIESCAKSLFEQSLDNIEYIFVDDCSSDTTVEKLQEVIAQYPKRAGAIKIIKHERNRGSAAARNTCIENFSGEYVGWCDTDDRADVAMFQNMYEVAKLNNADVVYCDFLFGRENSYKIHHEPSFPSGKEAMLAFLIGKGTTSVMWNKLTRRSLYMQYNIRCREGNNFAEDAVITYPLYVVANTVVHIPEALYSYQINPLSMGAVIDKKKLAEAYRQMESNIQSVRDFLKQFAIDIQFPKEYNWWLLRLKSSILYREKNVSKWKSVYPDSHQYLLTHPTLSKNEIIVEWCLLHHMPMLFWLKYYMGVIVKVVKKKAPLRTL